MTVPITITLAPADVALLDSLARRLGIQATGEDRQAQRRGEVVRRLLLLWMARQ